MKLTWQVVETPHGASRRTRTNPQTQVSGTKDKFDLLQTCNSGFVRSWHSSPQFSSQLNSDAYWRCHMHPDDWQKMEHD